MGMLYLSRCCPKCHNVFSKDPKTFILECEENICKDCRKNGERN